MSKTVSKTGLSLELLLAAAFIFCKLAKITVIATWSWWWVLSPLWGGLALFGALFLLFAIVAIIIEIFKAL